MYAKEVERGEGRKRPKRSSSRYYTPHNLRHVLGYYSPESEIVSTFPSLTWL